MNLEKYKYYFKKPRSEITKDVLYWLLIAGAVYIAASSPSFAKNLVRDYKKWKKYSERNVYDAFYNLRRQGLIEFRKERKQIYINLTLEGRKKAGYLQINDLEIKRPKNWDKKWRIVTFDISELKRGHREAFRGKLKELGFCQLQKSVWVFPFDCQAEIELLQDFFGLREENLRLIIAESLGDDVKLKEYFKIN
jgi:DNA-binding transcriptional regulator PaaX